MKLFKHLFFISFLSTTLWANPSFDKGNDAYQKGNYEDAISHYQKVIANNQESCDLYFNLANAHFKLNHVAEAIYYYEKALLISPNDEDIQNNLAFAKTKTIDDIKVLPKVGFEKWVQKITASFHFNTWGYIAVGFSILFFLFFLGYYFSETSLSKRIYFVGLFILPFLAILSISAGFFEQYMDQKEQPAIVFTSVVFVKNEPREKATEAFVLHEGAKVFILETLDDWRKIQLTDETEGWIQETHLKEIKN
jgi:tetratricopeptide (TPR) repeat protein